jgi:hypothetical protein
MSSFELDIIDEKSLAGAEFMARVISEIQRALSTEKATRKVTQEAIAKKIGTSRAVINRQIKGYENLTARRIGEILWAIGWEPFFEARKAPKGQNELALTKSEAVAPDQTAKPVQFLSRSGSNAAIVEVRT